MSVREDAQHAATEELLAAPLQAIFATNRSGRPPQLSPVWFIWEAGAMYVSTSARSLKARSVLVDNHVSVCVDAGPGDYRYLAMSGEAEVVPHGSELQQEILFQDVPSTWIGDESRH